MSRLKADWPVDVHRCPLRGPRRRSRKKEEEWQSPERQAFPHGGRRSRWKMSKVQTPLRGEVSTILNASYWIRGFPGTQSAGFGIQWVMFFNFAPLSIEATVAPARVT